MRISTSLTFVIFVFVPSFVWACDPCSLYNASRLSGRSAGSTTISISEQYTDYDRASDVEENSIRDGELVKGYSTTQFAVSFDATDSIGLQVTIPLIARSFTEIEQFRTEDDSDAGIGDVSLVGNYYFLNYKRESWTAIGGLLAGVKFPTGDTGILREVSEENGHPEEANLRHHQIGSVSNGRALTFGSGSYDYIFGLDFLNRYDRFLLLSSLQYTLRTEGDFNYEFADDLLWTFAPGYYVNIEHDATVAIALALSGEFKDNDELNGEKVANSGISNLYLGPQALFSLNSQIGGEVAVDFRITDADSGSTIVPEYRLRSAVSYRF